MPSTRRTFLGAAALLPLARGALAAAPAPVVDCHLHCFDGRASTRFPYHARAPYRPDKAVTPEQALACMDAAGVDRGVLVHPEPYQDDHRYLEHCLTVAKGRWKGTCLYFADRPGWREGLTGLKQRLGDRLAAFRVHAYAPERLPPFGKELRALWKHGADLGLVAQIHFEPHHARGFTPLISEFRATPVVIDNLGRPLLASKEEYDVVLGWARFPHVHMKLSALPNPDEYPFRAVAPLLRPILEAFGPDRLIWGGTFSAGATPESYRAGREALRAHLAGMPPPDQAKVLGGTAMKLFGWG